MSAQPDFYFAGLPLITLYGGYQFEDVVNWSFQARGDNVRTSPTRVDRWLEKEALKEEMESNTVNGGTQH